MEYVNGNTTALTIYFILAYPISVGLSLVALIDLSLVMVIDLTAVFFFLKNADMPQKKSESVDEDIYKQRLYYFTLLKWKCLRTLN